MAQTMLLSGGRWRSTIRKMLPDAWLAALRGLREAVRAHDRLCRALTYLGHSVVELACVAAAFFVCELLIWGIYSVLLPVGVEFLASIAGMVCVLLMMLVLVWRFPRTETFYSKHVRSKVRWPLSCPPFVPVVAYPGN